MKRLLIVLFIISGYCYAQTYEFEIHESRLQKEKELKDTSYHVLTLAEAESLVCLDYYPVDRNYAVVAVFTKKKGRKFKMPTSSERNPTYRKFGELSFELDGENLKLNVYQNLELRDRQYRNYLFLPFRDATSGTETYGAGRYLDLEIPEGDTILIDFNMCYNPYCAYSYRYSCPVPPKENTLPLAILAGEKLPKTIDH